MAPLTISIFNLLLLTIARLSYGHSWVERAYVLNGDEIVGEPGFPRGNVFRTEGFRDEDMMYRLPNGNLTLLENMVCKETQRTHNQTAESPALSAHANDTIYLMYQENGHVTKLKPNQAPGIIIVHGTSNFSSADNFQSITSLESAREIHGLRQTFGFDDGHCYEDNGSIIANERNKMQHRMRLEFEGGNLWCGVKIRLPEGLTPGTIYTLYWIWDFSGPVHTEVYTTCLDINVV